MSRARVASLAIVSAFVVAGCDVKMTGPPPGPPSLALPIATPTVAPGSPAPAPIGTATPLTGAAPSTLAESQPSAAPSLPPNPNRYGVIVGAVYDDRGAVVDGAIVTVRSLDASVPYLRTFETRNGAYEIPDFPEGANLEILVTRAGWTTRRRVVSFQAQRTYRWPAVIDFGAPPDVGPNPDDPFAAANFLSDRPEITAVMPASGATNVDPSRVAFELTLSEPLDAAAREALAAAIVLWPANAAAGVPAALDLAAATALAATGDGGTIGERAAAREATTSLQLAGALDFMARPLSPTIGYQIRVGDRLGAPPVRATATWNAEGTRVAFDFPVALQAGELEAAKYQIGLVAGGEPIRDESGLPLGTGWDGATSWPAPGHLVASAFYLELRDRREAGPNADPELAAWAATHGSVTSFETARDVEAPRLVDLAVGREGRDLRLAFRFSESMAAFDGTPGGYTHEALIGQADADPAVEDLRFLRRFVFALGREADDLGRIVIDGLEGDGTYDPAMGSPPTGVAFAFGPEALALSGVLADAADGEIVATMDPADPRVVVLVVKDRAELLDGAEALAVRVVGVADPAGNRISSSAADEAVVKIAL